MWQGGGGVQKAPKMGVVIYEQPAKRFFFSTAILRLMLGLRRVLTKDKRYCIQHSRLPRIKGRPYVGLVKSFDRASPEMEGIPEAKRNVVTTTAKLAN